MTNIRSHAALVVAAILFVSAAGAASKPITPQLELPKKTEKPAVVGGLRVKGEDVHAWRSEQPVVPAVEAQVSQVLQGW